MIWSAIPEMYAFDAKKPLAVLAYRKIDGIQARCTEAVVATILAGLKSHQETHRQWIKAGLSIPLVDFMKFMKPWTKTGMNEPRSAFTLNSNKEEVKLKWNTKAVEMIIRVHPFTKPLSLNRFLGYELP